MASSRNDIHADADFLDQVEAPVMELHRSNVLRLEVDELLQECRCDISTSSVTPVSWSKAAHAYLHTLESTLHDMTVTAVLNTNTLPCPFRLQSDKVTSPRDFFSQLADEKLPLVFPCHTNTSGLTTMAGNANVLPTLECTVLIRKEFFHTKDYLHHRYFDVS